MNTKQIGLRSAIALVMGNMIGSGIFLLPATLAIYGYLSLLGWLVSSIGALLLAYSFVRLSQQFPLNGGPYAYTRLAFGDFFAFMVAWGYWIALWTGNAAIAVAFVANMSPFFPDIQIHSSLAMAWCLGSIWLVTALNLFGIREAAYFQLLTTILRLLPILLLGTVGFYFFDWQNWSVKLSDFSIAAVATQTAALTFWSFLGIESATIPAASIHRADRNISLATWWGTLLSALVFVTACSAVMGILPRSTLAQSAAPFAEAAQKIWGQTGYYAVAGAAALACLGALNGWILLQGQVPHAVAKDGLFPSFFGQTNARGAPSNALIFSSVLMSIMVVLNYNASLQQQFQQIILLATLANLIPYVFCSVAEWGLRWRQGQFLWKNDWLLVLRSLVTLGFTVMAIVGTGWTSIRSGILLLLVGLPLYFWLKQKKGD